MGSSTNPAFKVANQLGNIRLRVTNASDKARFQPLAGAGFLASLLHTIPNIAEATQSNQMSVEGCRMQ